MASWIAWHSARQTVSTLCFLVLIAALLLDCNAQSLERGIRAPKNKFIRFGRSGQKFIRFGRNSAIANDDLEPRRVAYEDNLFEQSPFFKQLNYNKRAGQKFIRFG
uniref:Uncharacterized protein n=1 Tax=Panagrellus redivivus TaxID=6233 RepID=A0A7E4VVJ9_PANRE